MSKAPCRGEAERRQRRARATHGRGDSAATKETHRRLLGKLARDVAHPDQAQRLPLERLCEPVDRRHALASSQAPVKLDGAARDRDGEDEGLLGDGFGVGALSTPGARSESGQEATRAF